MSHQDRRAPLPGDYQFPTHGVDCDCPPCRNRVTREGISIRFVREYDITPDLAITTQTAYGWGV